MPRASVPYPEGSPPIGAGVRSLIHAGEDLAHSAARRPSRIPSPRLLLVTKWSLYAADVVLCGFVSGAMLHGRAPLGWMSASLCAMAVALGAWLACLAATLAREDDPAIA